MQKEYRIVKSSGGEEVDFPFSNMLNVGLELGIATGYIQTAKAIAKGTSHQQKLKRKDY